jgi:tRNA/rRNA methyltransferase
MRSIRLILVSPKYSGNVGACARVASNFDVRDIAVIQPRCAIHDEQAQLYGKGPSREFLMGMNVYDSLQEAVADCHQVIAITRRHGTLSPKEIFLPELRITDNGQRTTAIVFGREDYCLTREELYLCTHYCQIPTSDIMPTMNLSHAVSVVLSRLYTDLSVDRKDNSGETTSNECVTTQEFEDLMKHWEQTMRDVDLTRGGDPEKMIKRIRRAMQRSELRVKEMAQLRRFLSKVQNRLRA